MTPQAVVTFSVYFGLVAVGLVFVGGSFMAFWEGKTHLLMSTETVQGSDNPTLTVCFLTSGEPKYGTNFSLWIAKNKSMTFEGWGNQMREGENEIPHTKLKRTGKPFHMAVKQMVVLQNSDTSGWENSRSCLKVSPVEDDIDPLQFGLLEFALEIPPASGYATLYASTESNAYGAVFEKWYDGAVDPIRLQHETFHLLKISKIRETRYLPQKSQNKLSYYQCLSSKLERELTCQSPNMTANQRNPCSSYTLPTPTKFNDLPECDNAELATCKSNALIALHSREEVCKQDVEKFGIIKEFKIQEQHVFNYYKNHFGFRILMYAPESPDRGLRISTLYKEVFTETPLIDYFQIIGTIGGTLGMMVGFSFFGCIEWIGPRLNHLLNKISKRRVKDESSISTLTTQ